MPVRQNTLEILFAPLQILAQEIQAIVSGLEIETSWDEAVEYLNSGIAVDLARPTFIARNF